MGTRDGDRGGGGGLTREKRCLANAGSIRASLSFAAHGGCRALLKGGRRSGRRKPLAQNVLVGNLTRSVEEWPGWLVAF